MLMTEPRRNVELPHAILCKQHYCDHGNTDSIIIDVYVHVMKTYHLYTELLIQAFFFTGLRNIVRGRKKNIHTQVYLSHMHTHVVCIQGGSVYSNNKLSL